MGWYRNLVPKWSEWSVMKTNTPSILIPAKNIEHKDINVIIRIKKMLDNKQLKSKIRKEFRITKNEI